MRDHNCESRDIHRKHEVGLLHSCLPDKTLTFKGHSCHRERHAKHMLTIRLCVNIDDSNKQALIMVGKASDPFALKI